MRHLSDIYLFLTILFLLYGGLHLYVFVRAHAAFAFSTKAWFFTALFMLLMVLSPLIIHFSELFEFPIFARFMSWIGYLWMGAIFLFFSISICIDIYRLLVYAIGMFFHKDMSAIIPTAQFFFYIPFLLSLSLAAYGYFEALDIRTEKVEIKTSKIPEEIDRLRIVQISDLHLGLIIRGRRLQRILGEVQKASPDMLVSTGDLVDGQGCSYAGFSALFSDVKPKYGKFAVTGNHEFYSGLSRAIDFTKKSGFKVLRGEGVTVGEVINIAGVDDPAGKEFGLSKDGSEKELLSGLPRDKFTILLKHRPVVSRDSLGLFDLQLSGHAHGGQIFPFSLLTWLFYRHTVHAGSLRLVDNCYLYVSRGAGTWGPPIRVLSPPEITIIDLVHGGDKQSSFLVTGK